MTGLLIGRTLWPFMNRLFLWIAMCALWQTAQGQGTKADYERAYALRGKISGKVFKERISPQWLGGPHFWYQNRLRDGREWVLVDGAAGKRQAFSDKAKFEKARDALAAKVDLPPKPEKSPRKDHWKSPDGKWRVFARDYNVWIRATEGNEEIQLSHDGKEQDRYEGYLRWSPDSRYIGIVRRQQVDERRVQYVESSPSKQLQPKSFTRVYAKPGDKIPTHTVHVFEAVKDGKHFTVDPALVKDPFETRELKWRPDSSGLLFEHIERGFGAHRVIEIPVATGKARTLIDETAETFVFVFGNSFRRDVNDLKEIIWRSERDGWNHLYLYDGVTGKVKNQITKGQWVVREVVEVDEDKRQITFRASGREPGQDPYYLHTYRVNFDGTGLLRLTEGDGTHSTQVSPDKTVFIDTWSRVDLPPRHALRRVSDGKLLCELETADAKDLYATGWRHAERFVAKDRDGKFDIHGIICRPSNFDPKKKYPVVEVIYAGPHGSFVPKGWRSRYGQWRDELMELGFITVQIDGKGTNHRGREFQHFAYKNINDAGFPDRIKWMQAAAKKYPYMDLSRVGIYGGSAGGQNAMAAMLWHGEFYKAAAADCGCHDNRMDKVWWNEQWMDYPVGPHYAKQSNTVNAHRLQGALLLTVGELDTNVDPASTYQVVNALIKADKDFEFLMFPGGGHGVGESRYAARKRMDFFVRHLHGVEPRTK